MMPVRLRASMAGRRLDTAIAEASGLSRSRVQRLLKAGHVEVNGVIVTDTRGAADGTESVVINEPAQVAEPDAPELPILYEDKDVIVIDKPAGLVVHATESGRVQPNVAAFARQQGVRDDDEQRPGIVHRLDKETSGVMVIAKHLQAKRWLQRQFKQRRVEKQYIALVAGRLSQPEAEIRLPIGRDRRAPIKRAVVPGGRQATTSYQTIREYPGATLVSIQLHTGRTHQIRVHFQHIGHPVVADSLYGHAGHRTPLERQFLHASKLGFDLLSGKHLAIESPLPAELAAYLESLDSTV